MRYPKEARGLHKVTLNLFEGDFESLQRAYPAIGAGKVVRDLVALHVREIEDRVSAANLSVSLEEIKL